MSTLEEKIKDAAETAVLRYINDGAWIQPNYESRLKIPQTIIDDAYKMIVSERLEKELADRVINAMAAEISTDVKQILSVNERREALRAVVRENLDRILGKVK